MPGLILALSNAQAKSLAGRSFTFDGHTYYFKDYEPGQPPWRSGAEGKAFPLLNPQRRVVAYLKFFTTPSPIRRDRSLWLVAQQLHTRSPQLRAAPSAWVESRTLDVPFTGVLASAAPGTTWEELKFRISEGDVRFSKDQRSTCVRELLSALSVLEQADIIHGDLSPLNVMVDSSQSTGGPVLSLIDFDAFVARSGGHTMALQFSQGGTYGTPGYCPPDLVRKAEAGETSLAPYSDRYSRDMLMLELLLFGPEFDYDDPPSEWGRDRLKLRYKAFLGSVEEQFHPVARYLDPATVFHFDENTRLTSMALAQCVEIACPSPATTQANRRRPTCTTQWN